MSIAVGWCKGLSSDENKLPEIRREGLIVRGNQKTSKRSKRVGADNSCLENITVYNVYIILLSKAHLKILYRFIRTFPFEQTEPFSETTHLTKEPSHHDKGHRHLIKRKKSHERDTSFFLVMMAKPVIVLVPGAWHPPSCFSPLTKYLEGHGYTVDGISLPSVGSTPPPPNFDADVNVVASTVGKHADQGAEVILLFHSYGGVPGASACKGLSRSDRRAAGEKGGIVHLVYCCAFALDEGVCLMDGLGGRPLPWFGIAEDEKTLVAKTPVETFYNDIHDRAVLDGLVDSLRPHAYGAFWSKSTYAAWKDVASTYVVCERDAAIPPQAQRGMIAHVNEASGGKMREVSMDASHSPFVSRPEELGRIVREIAGEKV